MKGNVSTKIKNIPKSSDKYENEYEINYYQVKKQKQKFTKKAGNRKSFYWGSRSKFTLYSKGDTDNSIDDTVTDVDLYSIDSDKSFDSEVDTEFHRSLNTLYGSDYETW